RARRWRQAASAATSVLGPSRIAMRLLHAGLPDARRRPPRTESQYRRSRASRRAVIESLPLHRLSEHPQIGARSRSRNAQMSFIGQSVRRLEDRPLLTGTGRFAADIAAPDM